MATKNKTKTKKKKVEPVAGYIGLSKTVGENIRRLREQAKLSQSDLAAACGWHQPRIASIERGGVNHTLGTLTKLSQALEVTTRDLLTSA